MGFGTGQRDFVPQYFLGAEKKSSLLFLSGKSQIGRESFRVRGIKSGSFSASTSPVLLCSHPANDN
jgi:hypothetical protein